MVPFIILQVASVVAIIVFLRILLRKQLETGYKRIQMLDQSNLRKETSLNDRRKQLDAEYKTRMAEAEERTQVMIEKVKEDIKKMREDERVKIKDEAKRTIASALQQKEQVLKESERLIFSKGIDLATVIVKQMFSDEGLKGLRSKLSKEVVNALVDSGQVKESLKTNKSVSVISADALGTEDKKTITEKINKVSDGKVKIQFSVDKGTGGGLVFKIGDKIIDGSLAYRINKAAREIKEGGLGTS